MHSDICNVVLDIVSLTIASYKSEEFSPVWKHFFLICGPYIQKRLTERTCTGGKSSYVDIISGTTQNNSSFSVQYSTVENNCCIQSSLYRRLVTYYFCPELIAHTQFLNCLSPMISTFSSYQLTGGKMFSRRLRSNWGLHLALCIYSSIYFQNSSTRSINTSKELLLNN